jgi:hypothetical protein
LANRAVGAVQVSNLRSMLGIAALFGLAMTMKVYN